MQILSVLQLGVFSLSFLSFLSFFLSFFFIPIFLICSVLEEEERERKKKKERRKEKKMERKKKKEKEKEERKGKEKRKRKRYDLLFIFFCVVCVLYLIHFEAFRVTKGNRSFRPLICVCGGLGGG